MEPQTVEEAIQKARKVESNVSKERSKSYTSKNQNKNEGQRKENRKKPCYFCKEPCNPGHQCQGKEAIGKREELSKKGLCFKCKEPWAPDHQCKKGQLHRIEERSTDEGPNKIQRTDEIEHGTLAMVTQEGGKRPFCIKETLKGKRVITLIDSGASHNFISKDLITKRRLKTKNSKASK